MFRLRYISRLAAVVALLAGSLAPAWADHKELKPGFNMFSKEQDVQLGREAAAQVEAQMPVVQDRNINDYVQSIGRRLASQPEAGGFPYTFKVINDPAVNAFSLPGGPTFINTGLIRAVDDEAQLAGVMAHEIAHVALRHGTNQASKANLIQLPAMIAGSIAGGGGSLLGQLAQVGIGLGANSVLLKFSRTAESEADLLGSQIMAKAGYDPLEMARFFEKLEADGGSRGPQFLSDHPNPGNRRKNIQEEIRTLPQRSYSAGDTARLRDVQARIGGLPRPQQQAISSADRTAGVTRPSGGMKEYRGRAFAVAFPENWEAFGQPDSGMLTIAPRQGLVQTRGGGYAVGYGTVVSYYHPRYNDGRVDLDRETRDLIVQLQSSNPNMQVENGPSRTRLGNDTGLSTVFSSNSPFGNEQEIDILVTAARPEGLFYAVFVAPRSEYNNVRGVFDQMIRSIRF